MRKLKISVKISSVCVLNWEKSMSAELNKISLENQSFRHVRMQFKSIRVTKKILA